MLGAGLMSSAYVAKLRLDCQSAQIKEQNTMIWLTMGFVNGTISNELIVEYTQTRNNRINKCDKLQKLRVDE